MLWGNRISVFLDHREAEQDEVSRAKKEFKGNLSLSPLTFLHLECIKDGKRTRILGGGNEKAVERHKRKKMPMAFFLFPYIGTKYVVCSFLFFFCINFRTGERGATEKLPPQRVVFPYQRRLCEKFYSIPEIDISPISKSKLPCKFECNFFSGSLDANKCRFYLYMVIHTYLFLYIAVF